MTDASPQPSIRESTTLERLVSQFVAAKRSLSATAHVYRANEIVSTGRSLVEETAVLGAKNAFLRRGVGDEANALVAVRNGLDSVGTGADVDFKSIVQSLDRANYRLEATLAHLRSTIVDARLESRQPDFGRPEAGGDDADKTLYDFIDESTHLALLDHLRDHIDSYNAAQRVLQASQTAFDDQLASLDNALHDADQLPAAPKRPSPKTEDAHPLHEEDGDQSDSIPFLFHALTQHAAETASLLQSLVSHYDLCTTALKHTEGGGEAARNAADPASPQDTHGVEESLYKEKHREPMSDDERHEMLMVLENDAQEVDDVVLEIRERLSEMETQLLHLDSLTSASRRRHSLLSRVLNLLRKIGTELPSYIAAAKSFTTAWASLKEEMVQRTNDLVQLTDFYDSFVSSYASLLQEVSRRDAVETRMKRIAEKARREIENLYNEDLAVRDEFIKDLGEYLPRDIWPGLIETPNRWEVRPVPGQRVPLPEEGQEERRE
ncbi:hypothetical protein MBLNU459_g4271t1 [Dothideomycetes sp. NU459]